MGASLPQILTGNTFGRWVKVASVSYTDVSVASSSTQHLIYSLSAREYIVDSMIYTNTAWAGVGVLTCQGAIGTLASPQNYTNLLINLTSTTANNVTHNVKGGLESLTGATSIYIQVQSNVNLNNLTQGQSDVYLLLAYLP